VGKNEFAYLDRLGMYGITLLLINSVPSKDGQANPSSTAKLTTGQASSTTPIGVWGLEIYFKIY
jgi:hypothetical protein